jgi:(1->4)-alpha-D-glucan 1-alpha-D-glucosylmutase
MRIPQATYRIQFHSGFTFSQAKNIIDYLSNLGISDIYASPVFKASQGSTHGYDVVDPTQINPELGTPGDFAELLAATQKHHMGWLQDIVPNHMAYDSQNLWLMDVLEKANKSKFFEFFDINWHHYDLELKGRVLAPLLGDNYGKCLERGEIKLDYDDNGLSVNYYESRLPIKLASYLTFLTHNLDKLTEQEDRDSGVGKLLEIIDSLENTEPEQGDRQIQFIKDRLWQIYNEYPAIAKFIQDNLREFNGEVGRSESFDLLDKLLSEQFYRLSFWKVATEEINYRRFFTVNELISIKVEELNVFQKTHELIGQLVKENKITGVRIDHIDGLYDPSKYITRLRQELGDVYITVEKILELTERLPQNWQIQGSSGYEFLNYVNNIFCCQENEDLFAQIYNNFTNLQLNYESLVYEKKSLILETNLGGDLDNLVQILKTLAAKTREAKDFTIYGLKRTLFAILALFPVYRTYVDSNEITEVDRKYAEEATEKALTYFPLLKEENHFLRQLLLLEYPPNLTEEQQEGWLHFVKRSQQLTGPLMAKGVEDTLLYIYNRLLSLNEVGGNPSIFGIDLDLFHQFNQNKIQTFPHGMNATATHDTKRGEDMRARLNVLSEIPKQWEERVNEWRQINQVHKQEEIPDANDEYFFYQTILGAFPFLESELSDFSTRIKDYILKAIREAKVNTDWLRPNERYEREFLSFIDRVLESNKSAFYDSFQPFQKHIAEYGIYNSLSQVLIKNTAPGVPDLYQGAELWELSLVDPDNRRPVDYQKRMDFLKEIQAKSQENRTELLQELLTTKEDGKIKLFVIHQLLKTRQEYSAVFENGDYQPIEVTGKYPKHIVAFARNYEGQTIVAIAPRFLTTIVKPGQLPLGAEVWQDTCLNLPDRHWKNVIDGQAIAQDNRLLSHILANFPVALLMNEI